jgi:hypothetical protein
VGPHKHAQPRLGRWCLRLLLLVVELQILKGLEYSLHQLILVGNELLNLRVGLVLSVAALTIAVVPSVHHVRGF